MPLEEVVFDGIDVAAADATRLAGSEVLGAKLPWLTFLASTVPLS